LSRGHEPLHLHPARGHVEGDTLDEEVTKMANKIKKDVLSRLGVRARAYVDEYGSTDEHGVLRISAALDMPRGIYRTLCRVLGQPVPSGYMSEQYLWRVKRS